MCGLNFPKALFRGKGILFRQPSLMQKVYRLTLGGGSWIYLVVQVEDSEPRPLASFFSPLKKMARGLAARFLDSVPGSEVGERIGSQDFGFLLPDLRWEM